MSSRSAWFAALASASRDPAAAATGSSGSAPATSRNRGKRRFDQWHGSAGTDRCRGAASGSAALVNSLRTRSARLQNHHPLDRALELADVPGTFEELVERRLPVRPVVFDRNPRVPLLIEWRFSAGSQAASRMESRATASWPLVACAGASARMWFRHPRRTQPRSGRASL